MLYGMDSNPDLIAVSESRITDKSFGENSDLPVHLRHPDQLINGYKFIYDSAPPNGKPGGVGLFVKEGINISVRHDLRINCNNCENLWIETEVDGKTCIFSVIYRHPKHNYALFQTELINKIELIQTDNKPLYICGDININLLKCPTNTSIKDYFDDLNRAGCHALIDQPTRITIITRPNFY